MKIAQIAPLFESVPPKLYGGTERVVDNLTRGLVAAGAEVTVFCSGDSQTSGTMKYVWPEALRLSTKKILDPIAYQARTLEVVAKMARDFDVIHNHYDYGLLPLIYRTTTPILTTMHYRMDLPDLPAILDFYRHAPLVSISNSQRAPMPSLNWMSTIYHGLSPDRFEFYSRPGRYLAFLGRFSPEKGAHWAIEIAKASGVPLRIAAKINPEEVDYFESNVRPHIDGHFIEYVGEISESEKSQFLGEALALINPIDWPEPFGLVMIEAMACGTPVLARPLGSAPEIITDGVTGILKIDIRDLARSVRVCEHLDRVEIRRTFEKRFSIERMTREYLHVYRKLIAGHGSEKRDLEILHESAHSRRMAHDRWNFVHPLDSSDHGHFKGLS